MEQRKKRYFCCQNRSRDKLNEHGFIYPIVLILASLSMLLIMNLSETYLSQMGYIQELKSFYEQEISNLLSNDVLLDEIDYNEDDHIFVEE